MRRIGLIVAWSLVLVLTTSLTWQIVSAADDRVNDRPVTSLNVAAPVPAEVAVSTTTTVPPATTTSTVEASTTTTTVTPIETTVPTGATATTSTTTTSPSTTQPEWAVRSFSTVGGDVVVRYRPGEVILQTATPAPGFAAEIDESGPPTVALEFESDDAKVEFSASWLDGDLSVQISQSEDD